MKISVKWLNDWIDVADVSVEDLAHRLTMAGLEVEGVERLGEHRGEIVVGRIEAIEEHPKADRLVVCMVDVGEEAPRQIVCGAKNMNAGDRVPVALPGSQPPALDFEISERKVMGVPSSGMLCSEEELGLAKESEGLMLLPGDLEVGEPFFKALDLDDAVLHIGLTPNRSDCLSHYGVARELSALLDRPLRPRPERDALPAWEVSNAGSVEEAASLDVQDTEGCPRYTLTVVDNVVVSPSPLWLRRRLTAVGVRSINNIVDVTNFVMMDVGQPLHAFDLDKLHGGKIVVRRARAGETLLGIDHREYELVEEDLVIADAERPVAIAGVMGGAETEVTDETTRILVECAYFQPQTVRKSARRHGLHTESSHRFERQIDEGAVERNMQRAVDCLLRAHEHVTEAGPKVRRGMVLAQAGDGPAPVTITLQKGHANRLLGTSLSDDQVEAYMKALGMTVEDGDGQWRITVPTFRSDLTRAVDLIEEVARLYGYDNIERTLPRASMGVAHRRRADASEPPTIVSREVRAILGGMRTLLREQGLFEAVNYSFMGEEQLDEMSLPQGDDRRRAVPVANPLVKAHGLMRTTMVPSLIENLRTNLAQRLDDVALFEMGRAYFHGNERPSLGLLMTGQIRRHWEDKRPWDFFELKGLIEALAAPFDLEATDWVRASQPYLHPGVQASWLHGERELAVLGQIHPEIAQREEWEQPVYVAEVFIDELLSLPRRQPKFQSLARYPAITRDFAFLYDQAAPYADLRRAVDTLAAAEPAFGAILESVELFDVYEGPQVPEGKRSIALTVTYRSEEKTLTDPEVEQADRLLVDWLAQKVGAERR